jgi:hypothetical protein
VRLNVVITLIFICVGCGKNPPIEIESNLLTNVDDGFRAVSSSEFLSVLDHSRKVSGPALESAGLKVSYDKLMSHPKRYRGSPITVEGTLLRLFELPLSSTFIPMPEESPKAPLEAWILDHQSRPYRFIVSRLPTGWEPGQKLREVKATGYFLMKETFIHERKEFRFVPMLVGQRLAVVSDKKVTPEFKIEYMSSPYPDNEIPLPDLELKLRSSQDGTNAELILGNLTFRADDDGFEKLQRKILEITGGSGSPVARDLAIDIDADFECDYHHVSKAVSSCRAIHEIRFTVPHNPKPPIIHNK